MNKNTYIVLTTIFLLLQSCTFLERNNEKKPLAKVGSNFLYEEDLPKEKLGQLSDSTLFVNKYIDEWALKEILMEKARFNLPSLEQEKFDQLIQNYKYELYIKAYKDALLANRLTEYKPKEQEIKSYYEAHKETFRLNENLLKLRFIELSSNLFNTDEIKKAFFSFQTEDQIFLEQRSLEFKNYSLNDSLWVKEIDVLKQFNEKAKRISPNELALQNKLIIEDSLGYLFIKIEDRKKIKEQAPINYVKPTIEQILLNKKKIELEKKIDKEVLEYAIETNEYQKFN
ncbi:peptidyl-prolyl cis-trans isomerase [Psychroflexus maritimus]|uniref:Peptidyl-prolyl cis-trans isomerase n=1 Tax=Psychroflexus maritimus TaxID=2714865 RepID=A0A967ADV3_9FLAO|nr:peptidyl-prolyl cis-trans isomerase [Psychroflexus maritimus]NGZ88651.1 peptidyl-prolyl cis-trans isomerase [Psychroflexus maritimus]